MGMKQTPYGLVVGLILDEEEPKKPTPENTQVQTEEKPVKRGRPPKKED